MRQRQLASLRAEHAHALCEVREEHSPSPSPQTQP